MAGKFEQAISAAARQEDPRDIIESVKQAVAGEIRSADPTVAVTFTDYFNHTILPDMVLRWPGRQRERLLYIRPNPSIEWLANGLHHVSAHKPVVFTLERLQFGESLQNPSERARLSSVAKDAGAWITDPSGIAELAQARKVQPSLLLLARSLIRGGRGVVGPPETPELMALIVAAFGFMSPDDLPTSTKRRAVNVLNDILDAEELDYVTSMLSLASSDLQIRTDVDRGNSRTRREEFEQLLEEIIRPAEIELQPLRKAANAGRAVSPEPVRTTAGTTIRASRSKISRMENGRVGVKVRDVTDPLDVHGANAPTGHAGPSVARIMLGSMLQRFRISANISTSTAGTTIRASRSKISRMENGRVGVKLRDVTDLLDLYGVSDETERTQTLALARQSESPGWWSTYDDVMPPWMQEYIGLEAAAAAIRGFELQFVPELFQTAEYAREVTLLGYATAPDEEIERRVTLRLRRQQLLDGPRPPHIWMVIDEGALRRPVGSAAVMRRQLRRLAERAEQPDVTIQVAPFASGAHAAVGGSFTLPRFGEPDVPDVVYLEQLTSAVYLDKRADVERYAEAMDKLAIVALNSVDSTEFLAKMIRDT